ncbi:MAG: aldo/keto reductase, partial [Candidatus Methanofastidiosa archaeon]|nr:aldo/keto reductase [Candidatus Methanofastidiosa archaeon]
MNRVKIKNSDISITRVGFGCSNFGGIGSDPKLVGKGNSEEEAHRILDVAYQYGINYFDTATTYGNGKSEEILGKWIEKKRIPRESIVISSKVSRKSGLFPWNKKGLSKKRIVQQIKKSLKRLRIDFLDIFYIHAPDPFTPVNEVLYALNECIGMGLTKLIGISNVNIEYLNESLDTSKKNGWNGYSVVQNSYNYLQRSDELDVIPICRENDILYIGYSPLAGGILSGKYQMGCEYPENSRLSLRKNLYRSYLTEENFRKIDKLKSIADTRKLNLPILMYQWLYKNKN